MTKAQLAAPVAAHASMSRAGADAAGNAVFPAIADTIADEKTITIVDVGTFSTSRGRPARAETPAPARLSLSPPRIGPGSRPARFFATPSTSAFGKQASGPRALPLCRSIDSKGA